MKCDEVQRKLEEYHDGELEKAVQSEIKRHLDACKSCGAALRVLRAEDELYSAYRENLERSLDVIEPAWSRVQAGLQAAGEAGAPRRARRGLLAGISEFLGYLVPPHISLRHALAASVLVIISVAGTLLVVRYNASREDGAPGRVEMARSGGERNLESALRSIQHAEQEYLKAIRVLSDIIDKRKPNLDPILIRELEANLKSIDESIAATRKAYQAHPSDPELAQYMLAAYSKKVEILFELGS